MANDKEKLPNSNQEYYFTPPILFVRDENGRLIKYVNGVPQAPDKRLQYVGGGFFEEV